MNLKKSIKKVISRKITKKPNFTFIELKVKDDKSKTRDISRTRSRTRSITRSRTRSLGKLNKSIKVIKNNKKPKKLKINLTNTKKRRI